MKKRHIYICFGVLALVMALLYPREGKFQYEYQKGRPWVYETLIAPIDFPILKTEEEILLEKENRSSEVIDCYKYDEAANQKSKDNFASAIAQSFLSDKIIKNLGKDFTSIYQRGLVSDFDDDNIDDKVIFIKKDRRMTEVPAAEVYTMESAYMLLRQSVAGELSGGYDVDSLMSAVHLKECLLPNLEYDNDLTQLIHKEAVSYISPTKGMIYAGQLIVSKGEIVTADICQMLDSFKVEYRRNIGFGGSALLQTVCHVILVIAMVFMLFLSIYFTDKSALYDLSRLVFLLSLSFIIFLSTTVVNRLNPGLLLMLPYAAIILYSSSFFKNGLVNVTYMAMMLPVLVIPERGLDLYMINVVAGQVALYAFAKLHRGWLQFLSVAILFTAMFVLLVAFHLLEGDSFAYAVRSRDVLFIALNALLAVVLYPFVFIFEKIFGFVSRSKLRDLADTNNHLLQELQHKAPGTFQHSLQVANLAEDAARHIGADDMLVRVGALYHDIGKMDNPVCFVENAAPDVNYHEGLSPEESAQAIIKHVDDGMVLAKRDSLPKLVSDFILTHHGLSRTEYFYNVYCNAGGDPANTAPFTYGGMLPQTKEHAILMIADAVEAASRTLKTYTEETVSALVDRIFDGKMAAGQFAEADVTFKELSTVKEALKTYILQIHHARIAYPKRKSKGSRPAKA